MPKALTDALVRAVEPPARGQCTITDSTLRNFALRLSQGGSKTFVVVLGKGKRHTLGRYPAISLSEARSAARRILAEKELGRITPERVPFDDAVSDFLKDCHERVRARTLKNYIDYLRLLPFNHRPIASITPREIIRIFNTQTPSQREHLHRVARTFFRWCVAQHILHHSPIHTLPLPTGKPRARVLSEDELRAVYATARAGETPFHRIVALLVLLGARRGELGKLEWSWISGDAITLPAHATKNGREHTLPTGPEAQAIITRCIRWNEHPYLFPAARKRNEKTTVFNGWSKAKAAFDEECGVTGWVLHDLRRTFATNLQRLGVRLEVTEALLNHVSGTRSGIVGVYQRYQWLPEAREAILTYERWLHTL